MPLNSFAFTISHRLRKTRHSGSTDECIFLAAESQQGKGIEGAQIDLILDRRDQIINLCEMKYSLKAYDITPAYLQNCWTEEKSSAKRQIPARHCI